uniref:F-ATPase protein 6 n=1 Tax=Trissolcus japonicus TaxID=1388796 RepID=A0A8E7PGY2_9HYME|nr:ATP synthase F0 subunit 6 [Trissolcus japonicus]
MMSIFNIFDPSTNTILSLNWISLYFPVLFISLNFWIIPSRWNNIWTSLFNFLNNELNVILKKKIYKINFISLFTMIMLINFMGLFSFIFTASSHMSMNLSLALPMWMSFMIIGWTFNTNHMLTHQVPQGTPNVLMPFMVMIEFISNIIRPGTLSIRLTANMIAGHLLLTLISNNGNNLMFIFMMILVISQTLLMMLELSVAMIQSYVFTILLSLYSQEI